MTTFSSSNLFHASVVALSMGIFSAFTGGAIAGEADVVAAKVSKSGGTYRFSVSVKHADTGWDHYANKWEIVAADGAKKGTVLAIRTLAHPHVGEQPFTRAKSGVKIPDDVTKVIVRAGDSNHGLGGKEIQLDLK